MNYGTAKFKFKIKNWKLTNYKRISASLINKVIICIYFNDINNIFVSRFNIFLIFKIFLRYYRFLSKCFRAFSIVFNNIFKFFKLFSKIIFAFSSILLKRFRIFQTIFKKYFRVFQAIFNSISESFKRLLRRSNSKGFGVFNIVYLILVFVSTHIGFCLSRIFAHREIARCNDSLLFLLFLFFL